MAASLCKRQGATLLNSEDGGRCVVAIPEVDVEAPAGTGPHAPLAICMKRQCRQ